MGLTWHRFTLLILLSNIYLTWSATVPAAKSTKAASQRSHSYGSCRARFIPSIDPTVVESEQQLMNIVPVHKVNVSYETATFGMGCFWSSEALMGGIRGILRTTVGYAGGTTDSPTYRKIGDHTEVIEIDFDRSILTYAELLHLFWHNNEYGVTTAVKRQYMSLIQYHNEEQRQIAEQSKESEAKVRSAKIVTEISPKTKFYPAEDYHQKYHLQENTNSKLFDTLHLDSDLLRTSYVATRLNGYLSGSGGLEQFQTEVDGMGLTPSQKAYCLYQVAHTPQFESCGS